MRAMTVIAIIACSAQTAFATIQVSDTVVLGGRTYEIQEIPMLGLWDHGEGSVGGGKQKRPKFEATNSANWVGYRAKFEIRDSKFYLRKIVGQIDGKNGECANSRSSLQTVTGLCLGKDCLFNRMQKPKGITRNS